MTLGTKLYFTKLYNLENKNYTKRVKKKNWFSFIKTYKIRMRLDKT